MQGTINQGEAVGSSALETAHPPAHFHRLPINSIGSRGVSELDLASLQFHNYNHSLYRIPEYEYAMGFCSSD